MPEHKPNFQLKLDNVLVATDFSSSSKMAVLYATSIARRHASKLFVTHVVGSQSEAAFMDGWRAGQTEMTDQLIAHRLDGIRYELLVINSFWNPEHNRRRPCLTSLCNKRRIPSCSEQL